MSKATDPLSVVIHEPKANGSKVTYSFSPSRNTELQSRTKWHVDYQGIDVSHVSNDMFALVFLVWQLPVFLQSKARRIHISADFPLSEDVWQFTRRLMRNKGISTDRVRFDGLSSRSPEATDGSSAYGLRKRKTLAVVQDGVPHGIVRAVLTEFLEPEELSFRSLEIIFDAGSEPATSHRETGLNSEVSIRSDFGVTLRRAALGASPRAFSGYVIAAVPALIGGGFTRYATFLGGNRFWQHTSDVASIGNSGQRTENFQALADFLATAVNWPITFANVGRSLSALGAVRALNRLTPGWVHDYETAWAAGEAWSHRPSAILALVASSVDRLGVLNDQTRSIFRESSAFAKICAVAYGNPSLGWDSNITWEPRLGIHDFEHMELNELCHKLANQPSLEDASNHDSLLAPLLGFGRNGYPDLWNLRNLMPGEYRNGFEECISAVLEGVMTSTDWNGNYPLRTEAVQFKDIVELPRPWPMSFSTQQVPVG